jgi:Na+-translocating ferredoxin:NAD+ oxidoreductase RnfA subunit
MSNRQPYENSSKLSRNQIIINNFLGGISWGLGATVGLSLFFVLLSMIGKEVNLVPVVGSFASQVINYILATNHNLQH